MKIAYLAQMADVSRENGIAKKIRMQAEQWLAAGHEVRYFSLVPTTTVWPGLRPLETELVARGNAAQRPLRSLALCDRIRAWAPDVIYFRYAYHSAGLPRLFRKMPAIAEINSDDLTEYPVTLSWAKNAYHRATRLRVLRTVSGLVPVTHELADRFSNLQLPAEVIANGIDLSDFPLVPAPGRGAPLHLLFVGSAGTPWHGLERVAELAELFPEATIDVVGLDRASAGGPSNLHFHGALPRAGYAPLVARATAAIGTMALFRKRMNEACPLKVREYLASGLPVLAAYRDTDLPESADYFLRLPNDASPLAPHRPRIAGWLDGWRDRRVRRADIQHLDTLPKERHRLAFLARLAARVSPCTQPA